MAATSQLALHDDAIHTFAPHTGDSAGNASAEAFMHTLGPHTHTATPSQKPSVPSTTRYLMAYIIAYGLAYDL